MTDLKEYIKDLIYSVKNAFSSKDDKDDLDKIIEKEYENAFEILKKLGIIEHIEEKYNINYEKPELVILEDEPSFIAEYLRSKNEIIFSKKSIERDIDMELKVLGYKEIERSANDIQGIIYLYKSYNTILLYPLYIDEGDIRKAIEKFIIRLAKYHEIWHSIDFSILDELENGSIIDIDYPTILNNLELRASAFEVVMYYLDLVNGLNKHEKVYTTAHDNINTCRNYIERIDILENKDYMKENVSYDLGLCYGNIIVAKYGSSLEENIYKIIDDIIHLDKEKAIDVIKLYGDNLEWLSNDKNSDVVV